MKKIIKLVISTKWTMV